MKAKIHPKYKDSKVVCSCGETFTTRSTSPEIKVEICSKCHPFYTGKQKFLDSGGRVEKFQKKYAKRIQELKEVEEKAKSAAAKAMADKEKELQERQLAAKSEESSEKEAEVAEKQEEKAEEQPQE